MHPSQVGRRLRVSTDPNRETHKLIENMSKSVDIPQLPGCQAVRIPHAPNGSLPLLLCVGETLERFVKIDLVSHQLPGYNSKFMDYDHPSTSCGDDDGHGCTMFQDCQHKS